MYNFRIPVDYLKEGDMVVAVCPVLDVSAYGKTLAEATKKFKSAISAFFRETTANNTIDEVLTEKGWVKVLSKWSPPTLIKADTEEIAIR